MGLFDRFGKLVSSNMNALLDKADDPEKSLGLLIEEMREQIRRGRQDLISAVATEKLLRNKVSDIDKQITTWQRRAELAVVAGDEPLAREALLFKKRLADDRDRMESQREAQRSQALQWKVDLDRANAKLEELETKKSAMVARAKHQPTSGQAPSENAEGVASASFDELRRMEEKLERAAAHAEAHADAVDMMQSPPGSTMTTREVGERIEELASAAPKGKSDNSGVEDELRAMLDRYRVKP